MALPTRTNPNGASQLFDTYNNPTRAPAMAGRVESPRARHKASRNCNHGHEDGVGKDVWVEISQHERERRKLVYRLTGIGAAVDAHVDDDAACFPTDTVIPPTVAPGISEIPDHARRGFKVAGQQYEVSGGRSDEGS